MASRIPGQFVPLHVQAMHDEKIVKAGPWVELLYYRALQWCGGHPETDGVIPRYALAEIGRGVRQSARRMHEGCTSDLFVIHEDGWRISAWDAWNASYSDIKAKRAKGAHIANHKQGYHQDKFEHACPLCTGKQRSASRSASKRGNAQRNAQRRSDTDTESGTTYHSVSPYPHDGAGAPPGAGGMDPDPERHHYPDDWRDGCFMPADYLLDEMNPHEGGWSGTAWHQPSQWRPGWSGSGRRPRRDTAGGEAA